jgi:hypothetical protein
MLTIKHCWSISTAGCLTSLLTALILLRETTSCFHTWRSGWDHSASTIMSWWKVSECGWPHRQQISLTQAYRNLFPDMTSVSIPAVTKLRSNLSMYIFFAYNKIFFSLLVLLTAHWRLLSEQPSYFSSEIYKSHEEHEHIVFQHKRVINNQRHCALTQKSHEQNNNTVFQHTGQGEH